MADSLREQLIKAGFKPSAKAAPKKPRNRGGKAKGRRGGKRAANDPNISLEQAYAIREKQEQRADLERKRAKMREDAKRKAQNDKLQALLGDRACNDPEAEIPRHFRDGDRITRIYVTESQRDALAEGRLGIVKLRRRYLLVDAEIVAEAARIKADAVVDLSEEPEAD